MDLEKAINLLSGAKGEATFINTASSPSAAKEYLTKELMPVLNELSMALKERDVQATMILQEKAAARLATLRAMELPAKTLPYTIPAEYDNLPRLMGRAKVEMKIKGKTMYRDENGIPFETATIVLDLDGYHAPLTSGAIVDLVQKRFYDGMLIQRSEELIVQTGSTASDKDGGYIDPSDGKLRTVPLEIFYKNDQEPV